jgi:hypothetical protein
MLGADPQQIDYSAAINQSGTRQQIRAGVGPPDSPHGSNPLADSQQPNKPTRPILPLRRPQFVDLLWTTRPNLP